MNSKIFSTLMMALHDYKRNWNDKRTDDKYGPVPSDCQEIINKQIEKIDESMSYVRSIPIEDEPKSLNPLCEFMRFFQFSLNIFGVDGNRVFLTDVQIRELHKIHNNDKVKVNWARQSGKDTVILSYLVYLAATKGKTIFIDGRNHKHLEHMINRIIGMTPDWFLKRKYNNKIFFETGGVITTDRCDYTSCDVVFANDYDYGSFNRFIDPFGSCNKNKKMIIATKGLLPDRYVLSTINWDELPGRDECFKQEMIKSIGLDAWYKEFEVTGMCEEFTASKMRKTADEQNCEADKKLIEQIEKDIKEGACKGDSYYYIDKPLSEYVKRHFRLRGFDVEGNFGLMQYGTRISW